MATKSPTARRERAWQQLQPGNEAKFAAAGSEGGRAEVKSA
jgi:hypothetical protein